MYLWIWRHLPGPTWSRLVLVLLLLGGVVAVLFAVVFPALAPYAPFNDNTVSTPSS